MAWYTEQLLADYLNLAEDHKVLEAAIKQILSSSIELKYGTQKFNGKEAVIRFLDETANAISASFGFRAMPVIIVNSEDSKYRLTADMQRKAVALSSKLEAYISWFFFIHCDDNSLIDKIEGTQDIGYQYYYDLYEQGHYGE